MLPAGQRHLRTEHVVSGSAVESSRRRACMYMGSWSLQNRACQWVLRCCKACLEGGRYERIMERRGHDAVSAMREFHAHRPLILPGRVIGVPSSTCYMLTYDHLLRNVIPQLMPYPLLVPLTAGIVARSTISSITSPLELIRTNLQSTPLSPGTPHTLRSVLTSTRALVKSQGVLSLWRGLGPTLWRDVPFSGVYWASYESWKGVFARRQKEGALVAFICGAVSGTTAALLTSPFDVLKTRRQAFVMSGASSSITGTIPLTTEILRTEGVSALFAGLLPRIVKIAPACGIMIASFEVMLFSANLNASLCSTILTRALENSWLTKHASSHIYPYSSLDPILRHNGNSTINVHIMMHTPQSKCIDPNSIEQARLPKFVHLLGSSRHLPADAVYLVVEIG